jgi:hypothetical protein
MRVAGVAMLRGATVLAVACALGAIVMAQATAGSAALSAADRVDIHQLVARYAHSLEGADGGGGQAFAALFTPDGTLVDGAETVTGHAGLAAFAAGRRALAAGTTTLATNVVIESAPRGAAGTVYVMVTQPFAAEGRPAIVRGGRFEDRYVKTAQGWRFARRQFEASRLR